jgi:uncharacterized protein (AIM24 family)
MLLEVNDDHAVAWTKPEDFPVNVKNPLEKLLRPGAEGFLATFADGSVRFWVYDPVCNHATRR